MITAGIDLGETYVKAVILKDTKIGGYSITPTSYNNDITARLVLGQALEISNLDYNDIDFINLLDFCGRPECTYYM